MYITKLYFQLYLQIYDETCEVEFLLIKLIVIKISE